jgi:hypothetical protein
MYEGSVYIALDPGCKLVVMDVLCEVATVVNWLNGFG